MSDCKDTTEESEDNVFESVYKWGTNWINYAQAQLNTCDDRYASNHCRTPCCVCSFLSPEDLEVVDPEGENAQKAGGSLVNPDDVLSLCVLCCFCEVLQKMAEIMEYTSLLDKANAAATPVERLAYVTAFAITPYGAIERAWKPFNPILGETFELECGDGVHFIAEQVSHHPPIGAAHAENGHFSYDIVSAPKTKFMGNSADIYPYGRTRITLKSSGETFSIIPPSSRVCNLIIGRTWIDTFGKMSVINVSSGDRVELDFVPCGWFGAGRYEFSGTATVDRKEAAKISGMWNGHCDVTYSDYEKEEEAPKRLWTCAEKPETDDYGRTYFCYKCSSGSGISEPLATDSRRRPDLDALDRNDPGAASTWKYRIEEMQRAEKRERASRSETWEPKWFKINTDFEALSDEYTTEDVPAFEWNGAYSKRPISKILEETEDVSGIGFDPWCYPEIHSNPETEDA